MLENIWLWSFVIVVVCLKFLFMLGVLILEITSNDYITLRKEYSFGVCDKFYFIPTITFIKCNKFWEFEIDIFKVYMYIVITYEKEE